MTAAPLLVLFADVAPGDLLVAYLTTGGEVTTMPVPRRILNAAHAHEFGRPVVRFTYQTSDLVATVTYAATMTALVLR